MSINTRFNTATLAPLQLHKKTNQQKHSKWRQCHRVLAFGVLLPANICLAYCTGLAYGFSLLAEASTLIKPASTK